MGKFAGIEIGHCDSALIENCRVGFEPAFDGKSETTQASAILAGVGASNVLCRANHVGGVAGAGAVAYAGQSGANGNTIEAPSGIATSSGTWIKRS